MPLTRKLASKSLIKQNTNQDVIGTGVTNLVRDAFTGTGSQTVFTLSVAPLSAANTQVFISGVYQNKNTYTISGTTLTFSTPPPNATNIEVISGTNYSIGVPGDGAVTTVKISSGAAAAGTLLTANGIGGVSFTNTLPTIQKFTSGSGTYNTPANCKYIKVKMVGGGGGGGGSGVTSGGAGGAGTSTSFGTSLLTANGGSGGSAGGGAGGTGGSVTVSLPATSIVSLAGGNGQGAGTIGAAAVNLTGGMGASSPFGGAGSGSQPSTAGVNAISNSGSGGGGGGSSTTTNMWAGTGGGAGGYIEALIVSPSLSYAYSVGLAGTAGSAGTSGFSGGLGGSGVIIIEEYYQ